jgi:hypothetical protein
MSSYLLPAVILAFCAPAVFIPASRVKMILWIGIAAIAIGAAASIWGNSISPTTLAAHPALLNSPLHPEISNVIGGVMLLFGVGLFLALGSRVALLHWGAIKPR